VAAAQVPAAEAAPAALLALVAPDAEEVLEPLLVAVVRGLHVLDLGREVRAEEQVRDPSGFVPGRSSKVASVHQEVPSRERRPGRWPTNSGSARRRSLSVRSR
jgi:hypothetical protein